MMHRRALLRLMGGVATPALIPTALSPGRAFGTRGICYAVFEALPLEHYGNRIPQITAMLDYACAEIVRCYGIPRHMLIDREKKPPLESDGKGRKNA